MSITKKVHVSLYKNYLGISNAQKWHIDKQKSVIVSIHIELGVQHPKKLEIPEDPEVRES